MTYNQNNKDDNKQNNTVDMSKIVQLRDEISKRNPEILSDGLRRDSNGKIIKGSTLNVSTLFDRDSNLNDLFIYNQFTGNVELYNHLDVFKLHADDIEKADVQVQKYIEKVYGVCFEDRILTAGKLSHIYDKNYSNPYNPMKDYLNAQKWDGKPRLENMFIDYLGAENTKLNKQIARKWMIGAVERVFIPGCKFELVPVLVGSQGRGKSTLCSALCPVDEKGQAQYFLDNLPSLSGENKDNYQLIHDNWIIELSELSAMNKSRIESAKQFISQTKDQYRKPYAATSKAVLRSNAFIGTTNQDEFLRDRTGNRRFLPVEIDKIRRSKDVFNIDREDITQIIAEAVHYFKQGEKPVLDAETVKELQAVQANHMTTDIDEDRIKEFANLLVPEDWENYSLYQKQSYFVKYLNDDIYSSKKAKKLDAKNLHPISRFNARELAFCVFKDDKATGRISKKISSVMQTMGNFEHKSYRVKQGATTKQTRGYVRK